MKINYHTLFLLFFSLCFYAQQGKLDPTFNTIDNGLLGDGFDGIVRTIVLQPDNKLLVGGNFNSFNGTAISKFSRLDNEGQIDPTFSTGIGFNNNVYCSLLLPDSKIIVGGNFSNYNKALVSKIVKLDENGALDPLFTSNLGTITSGIVHAMAVDSYNNIIVAGTFTKIGSTTAIRIARLSPNGALDPTFSSGTGASHQINTVAIQSDNKIVVGGNFVTFSGINKNQIVRLNTDGSIDESLSIGAGFNGEVQAIAIQSDGKILVGGNFTMYDGNSANKIIRINADGTVDFTFIQGTGFNNGIVYEIKVDANGSSMIGGSFTGNYNGTSVNRVVYLQSNGLIKSDFDIGAGPESSVYSLTTDNNNYWYLGGNFATFDGLNQGRLTKITTLGALEEGYLTANVGFNLAVLKAIPLANNKIIVGGSFKKFNGVGTSTLVRINENGTLDTGFNSHQLGTDNTVRAVLIQPDDKIIIGGAFKNYNGIPHNRIIGLNADGTIDASFTTGAGFNNQVYVIKRQNDGKVLIGGNFTSYNGFSVNRIIRLNSTGTIDLSFNPVGADNYIEAIEIQPDGKIIIGGRFDNFNAKSSSKIIRLNPDGSTDNSFVAGVGFNNNVYAIALQPDGKILVGGSFTTYKGLTQKRFVRLNADGAVDTTFQIGSGFSKGDIRTILLQKDGRILVGGTFTGTYNAVIVSKFLRLQKNGTLDPTISVPLNGTLYSLAFTFDDKLVAGGNFNSVAQKTKHRIARLRLCTNSSTYSQTWSNETAAGGMELIFNEDYTFTSSLNACSCFIAAGKTVTVNEDQTLGLVFDYSGLGTLNIKNKASLYQDDDEIINTGVVHLDKKTTPMKNYDYTYWSSPVKEQNAQKLSPNTASNKYYAWDKNWVFHDGDMKPGSGYIIRVPQPGNYANGETPFGLNGITYEQPVKFEGVPNNGIITGETTSQNNYYLIGNPYPSAIDIDAFLAKNAFLNGTIYLWTHDTALDQNASLQLYNAADYAIYNQTGAVVAGPQGVMPTGKVASGQAFFVSANGIGTITFNNNMRLIGENNLFFKPSKINKRNTVKEGRLWLNLTNEQGAFKQLLIGYCEHATNDYDTDFDAITMNANSFIDFYSQSITQKYAIQGRALPFEFSDEVSLGYSSKIKGTFTIAIPNLEGIMKNKTIYLEDKTTKINHNLSKEPYSFSTEIGTFDERFVVRYQNVLSVSKNKEAFKSIWVSFTDKKVIITSEKETIQEITIYDMAGQLLFEKNKIYNNEFKWDAKAMPSQVVLVKIKLSTNQTTVQKVILH